MFVWFVHSLQQCESRAIDLDEEKKKMEDGIKMIMYSKVQLLAEFEQHIAVRFDVVQMFTDQVHAHYVM